MKIAFFDTKSYWKDSFGPMAEKYGYEITFFNERLTPATAHLAAGHDATCSFVNDEVPAEVIRELKDLGIKVLLLRCAGFDSVDLAVAKECGLPVLRVPAYSPQSVAGIRGQWMEITSERAYSSSKLTYSRPRLGLGNAS